MILDLQDEDGEVYLSPPKPAGASPYGGGSSYTEQVISDAGVNERLSKSTRMAEK